MNYKLFAKIINFFFNGDWAQSPIPILKKIKNNIIFKLILFKF